MKTIFIPIFQGSEAKNVLRNDIFAVLRKNLNLRIILLVPTEEKKSYFQKEFFGNNIVYEVLGRYEETFIDKIFVFIKRNLIPSVTSALKRRNTFYEDHNFFRYILEVVCSSLFARPIVRKVVRFLDFYLVPPPSNILILFEKYHPSLVFSAHIFGDLETGLLKVAKRRGVKTMGLINSWDKITSRGMVRILPQKLFVHNEIIKSEALRYLDVPERDILVVGIPHYDIFVSGKPNSPENFYSALGLDSNKRFLTLCPIGSYFSDVDSLMINAVTRFKKEGLLPADVEILVRFPPNDQVNLESLENKELIHWDQPGKRFSATRGIDWDMNESDIQRLYDTLYYTSLVICHVSTVVIDAAVFDKPVINYDLISISSKAKNPSWLYKTEHFGNIIKTEAAQLVRSEMAMLEWINAYLANPEIHKDGRNRLVAEQCGPLDGHAGERVAKGILTYLQES